MARNNVQTTVHVGMDVQLAKRNAEALKEVIVTLKNELKQQRAIMESPINMEAYNKASEAVNKLTLQIQTLQKVQKSATPASAYESYISGDAMNSNTLRQAQRGAKNRLNTVRTDEGDAAARQFINDTNAIQRQLNRLQAGFTSPFRTIKQELNSLSGGELQRLHQLLQQEQPLVQGNEKAWASYSAAIAKVEQRMREYDTEARQQMGASTLSKAQSGGFATANERDMQRAIDKLKEYRAVINDPNGSGKATYEATNAEIQKLQANLDVLKQKELEATGQSMSRASALQIGMQTLNGTFTGTTQQLNLAKQALEANMLTVKRGGAEYNAMRQALNGIELELKNVGTLSKEVQAVLDQPKGKSFNALKQAVEQGRLALNAMDRSTEEGQKAFDELAAKVKAADIEMKNLGNSSKGTASAFDKAWSRLKTYVGLYVGAAVAMQKLSQAMGDLLELSDKMGEVRKTTGFTADEVGRLSGNLAKLDTRTSLTSLMELSSLAGSVGLKTQEQVQGFTEAADQLIVALPELGNESARTIIKISNATGDLEKNGGNVRETLEKVGSTIIALRANSASAAGPITDFVSRVGAVGAQAGISIDQIAALGSTIDALGGRVEMSATALSRMIPAIKNNSFAIANSIGVTEKYLKSLAPMEQMVLIFQKMRDNIQHIDISTEEGMNAMADNVEAMLGKNATMREVMKDLEQQGARAGIVFGLLSRNVDELQKQLGIASEAYRENTALANEFNNMNETAAAKWERLKNQFEEAFVGDSAQRSLGDIIDGLRKIVDLLTGNVTGAWHLLTAAIYAAIAAWSVFKVNIGPAVWEALVIGLTKVKNAVVMLTTLKGWMSMRDSIVLLGMETKQYIALKWALVKAHTEEEKAAIRARLANNALSKSLNANVILAIVAAIWAAVVALKRWYEQAHMVEKFTRDALASATAEIDSTTKKVDKLFESIDNARRAVGDAHLEVEKAEKAVREAKKVLDEGRGSVEDLEKAENNLKIAHQQVTTANYEHKASIEQINKLYSPYLGYMLSEISTAAELANARELINAKLRETILLKQRESAYDRVEGEFGEKRDKERKDLYSEIDRYVKDVDKAARLRRDLNDLAKKYAGTDEDFSSQKTKGGDELAKILNSYGMQMSSYANSYSQIKFAFTNLYKQEQKIAEARNLVDDSFNADLKAARVGTENTKGTQQELREQFKAIDEGDKGESNGLKALEKQYKDADEKNRKQRAADLLHQMDAAEALLNNAKNYYDLKDEKEAESYKTLIDNGNKRLKGLRAQREQLLKEAGDAYKPVQGSSSGAGGTVGGGQFNNGSNSPTPYGSYNRVTSPYQDWDADALVTRRKEMLERVRALANGADVQAVLSEDAKFISEATRKNIKDTKQAIEWYNTERLKIQDALHERYLTNTGDWMDPKKGGSKKPKFYESDYALAELDRYYSRRKEALEKAREDENMTEAMFNREVELLEQEHLAKRSKLRETFTSKDKQMIEQFRQWWATLAETGDLAEVPWATVESEWSKATDAQWGANNRKAQEDLTALQGITVKHLNAIAKIIDKERPYDGITANLRDNLLKMDILLADYQKNGPTEDTAALVKAQTERLKFLLGEAETAYTSTIEDVLRRMGEAGMTAWAEEIRRSPAMQNALMAQLQTAYDEIQNAIKKEASLIKKQTDIWWNDIAQGQTQSRKGGFEKMLSDLGLSEDRVKRANQLIGAGQASERVADKLAIAQMKVRLQMQETYYQRMRQMWADRIASLRAQGKEVDAQHAEMSRNLSLAEEQKKLDEQRVAIVNQLEESNNRLYTELKSWADLLTSSLQSVFEASHAGDAEYYNELAKLNLTGKGGPGAGTYIVIDNEGTSDATAHYEYLDEREALERQHEIERENAMADAWKKVMDDINMKMSETITDQLNAMLQNASLDANTDAENANTKAILANTEAIINGRNSDAAKMIDTSLGSSMTPDFSGATSGEGGEGKTPSVEFDGLYGEGSPGYVPDEYQPQMWDWNAGETPEAGGWRDEYLKQAEARAELTEQLLEQQKMVVDSQKKGDKEMTTSTQSMFAKMTQAANLYGIAYQAMSNDNMSMEQKFEMIALQAAGNAAMTALTVNLSESEGSAIASMPGVLGKMFSELGPIAGPIAYAAFTALLGGLMGLAVSKVSKSKSQIAQVTGANNSVASGRLATGMLTYAEGNVNEFTDPSSLTPGKQYNVDAADGRTYRARYMGRNPKTHLTNGPEFHLSGERGREMIIDAGTTRQITMNEGEIWHAIQTLSGGGRISALRRRGRGVAAFADGNVEDFIDGPVSGDSAAGGMDMSQMLSLQASIDRQSDLLEDLRINGIKATFDVYGKGGLVDSYDSGKKTLNRYGQRY